MSAYATFSNIVFIILIAILSYVLLKNREKGCIIYLALAPVSPYLVLGSFRVSFEIAGFLVVFFLWILKSKWILRINKNEKRNGKIFIGAWFILFCGVTLLNLLVMPDLVFRPTRIFGLFRFVFMLIVLSGLIKDRNDFFAIGDLAYRVFIMVNIPILMTQYMFRHSLEFYNTLFGSAGSSAYAREIEIGFYTRGYGTMISPTALGIISGFIIAFYIARYFYFKNKKDIFKMALGIIIGALSGSKMFIFSFGLLLVLAFFLIPVFLGKKGLVRIIITLSLSGCFLIAAMVLLDHFNQLGRLLNYINDPVRALASRYGEGGSIYNADKTILFKKLIFGYGATISGNELIGDSFYYVIIHDVGFFGALAYFAALIVGFLKGLKNRDYLKIAYVILIFGMGVGDPLYFGFSSILATFYIFFIDEKCFQTKVAYHRRSDKLKRFQIKLSARDRLW